jgi:Uma2 family endonuclease
MIVQSPPISLEQFLQLPETKPAKEYFDQEITEKPMPQGKHSIIQAELVTSINTVIKPAKIGVAFPELRCTFADRSIVPDIAVFTWSKIPLGSDGSIANTFNLAPDWLIEIASPEQSLTKLTKKIVRCLEFATTMGWLIDPDEQTILVYTPGQQVRIFDQVDQPDVLIPVPDFAKNLHLTVNQIFSWLFL